jgi:hypothetical protein
MMFYDQFGDSINCIEFDSIDMVNPRGGIANTANDDLSSGLSRISRLASSPAKVRIGQDRQINSNASISNLTLEGAGSGSRILTNGPGSLSDMNGLDKIIYGGVTYSIRRGFQYASAQPAVNGSNGVWGNTSQIFSTSVSPGGSLGWIKTSSGPDVWKTFGSISA